MIKKKYYSELNILRIIYAIAICFFYHYGGVLVAKPFGGNKISDFLYSYGYLGVEGFFFVSGFVNMISYDERKCIDVQTCLKKKIIRLYPTMICSVLFIACIQFISIIKYGSPIIMNIGDGRNTFLSVIVSILGINSGWFADLDYFSINGPSWYISVLMICYIFFYVIQIKHKNNSILLFALLCIMGIALYIFGGFNVPLLYWVCGRGYLNFFGGALYACFVEKILSIDNKKKILIIIISFLLLLLTGISFKYNFIYNLECVFSIICNISIFNILLMSNIFSMISDCLIIKKLSDWSFGVFLWNIPIFALIKFLEKVFELNINYEKNIIFIIIVLITLFFSVCSEQLDRIIKSYLIKNANNN